MNLKEANYAIDRLKYLLVPISNMQTKFSKKAGQILKIYPQSTS